MNAHATFQPKHKQYRRNAHLCALLAKDAATPMDRWTLLTMQQSWIALAENEEWLVGKAAAARRRLPERIGQPEPMAAA